MRFKRAEHRQHIINDAGFDVADFVERGVPRKIGNDGIENAEINNDGDVFSANALKPCGGNGKSIPAARIGSATMTVAPSMADWSISGGRRDCSREYTAKPKVLASTKKSPLTSLTRESRVKSPSK